MATRPEFPDSKHFKIETLTERVYGAIAKDDGGAICNVGIVDLGESLVVFDSFITPQAAQELRSILERTLDKPIRYLINSHYHNEHIRGNQVFSSSTDIICSNEGRNLIETKGADEIKEDTENSAKQLKFFNDKFVLEKDKRKKHELKMMVDYNQYIIDSLPNIKLILPNLTFEKKLTLRGSKSTVEIINTGMGHTANDIVMYVSEDNVLIAGDLVFVNFHPYLANGYPDKWVNTLNRLKDLRIDSLIPGHGPIGKKGHIDLMIQYITDMREFASKFRDGDKVARRSMMSNIPTPYDAWVFGDFFFPPNIQFFIEKILN